MADLVRRDPRISVRSWFQIRVFPPDLLCLELQGIQWP